MLPLKFHRDILTSFGTFDSLKYSLRNVKIGQNQNFESRKTDKKKYFHVSFYTFKESTLLLNYVKSSPILNFKLLTESPL